MAPFAITLGLFTFILLLLWLMRLLGRQLRAPERRRRERLQRANERLQESLGAGERLRESDPDFDDGRFEERVARAFLAVKRGLASGDLSRAGPLVSDGVYERLALELQDRRRRGISVEEGDWQVEAVSLTHVEVGAVFDQLTAGIRARVEGDPVGEFWTFLRRHGARTRDAPGLLESRCPNCGTPVERVETAQCQSCSALLRSGEHDWVLAEITQPAWWRPRASHRIPGVPELKAADPGFSPQHLEDRVGVLFWRLLVADRERRGAARLAAVADPAWCARYESLQAARTARSALTSCAEVWLRGIEVAGAVERDGWHRIAVTAAWSGWLRGADGRGATEVRGARLFVLARSVGATTDLGRSISSAHCPGCGAPERGESGALCAYCGETLNDGRHGWILVDTEEAHEPRARELLREFTTRPVAREHSALELDSLPEAVLPWVARLLSADAPVGDASRRLLADLARRWDLDPSDEALLAGPDPAKDEDLSRAEVRRVLPALIDTALASDALGARARRVLEELALRVGLTAFDARAIVDAREREWDGRAEAERREAEEREQRRSHLEWHRSLLEERRYED